MNDHRRDGEFSSSVKYDDAFATCERTYATLVVHKVGIDHAAVARTLGWVEAETKKRPPSTLRSQDTGGDRAFFTSDGRVDSRDLRRHLDWLLDQIRAGVDAVRDLRDTGHELYVSAYWMSAFGHGGPILSPKELRALGAFDLDVDFDIYFAQGNS